MYGIDYLEQNAYYEANTNSINILLGIIYSYKTTFNIDVNNLDTSYYKLLGTIGFTIGHELSHALDSNGSKYDGNGNYINWWTEEDLNNFNKLNIAVVKYYNNYNQFGTATLGENIADLGGMAIVMDIAKSRGATENDYKTYILSNYKNRIHDIFVCNNTTYITLFYNWLYRYGKLNMDIRKQNYRFTDTCDFNNVYLWMKPLYNR
jgi:predicted metalloendopeptidase